MLLHASLLMRRAANHPFRGDIYSRFIQLDYPQLGGVVVPNDGLCYTKDREYTASKMMVSLKKIHLSS